MRLKSHESPRHQGRNYKGKGGSARKRQIDKRNRTLIQRLRKDHDPPGSNPNSSTAGSPPAFL
ncbi:MAG: hypothetical protein HC921_04920 [Synechococcaceae cyanobacterium SM2_3_1]|nr:hypothetical protein [Synechococcaceae cyanobacterium SM2_3_1]